MASYNGSLSIRNGTTNQYAYLTWRIKDVITNSSGQIISSKVHWDLNFSNVEGTLALNDFVKVNYGFGQDINEQTFLTYGDEYQSVSVDSDSINYPNKNQNLKITFSLRFPETSTTVSTNSETAVYAFNCAEITNFEIDPSTVTKDTQTIGVTCTAVARELGQERFTITGFYYGYKIADTAAEAIPTGHNDNTGLYINSVQTGDNSLENAELNFYPSLTSYPGKYIRIFAEVKNQVDDVYNTVVYSDAFVLGSPSSVGPPTVNPRDYTVSNEGTTVTIGLSANYEMYYALSSSAAINTRIQVPANKTFDVSDLSAGNTRTFYFWTKAGSTWSTNYSYATVYKSATAGISSFYPTSVNVYLFNGSNGASGNLLGWANALNGIKVSITAGGTLTRTVEMLGVNDLSNVDWTSSNVKTVSNAYEFNGATTDYSLGNIDLDTTISTAFNDRFSTYKYYVWRVKAAFGGDTIYIPNNNGTYENKYYAVAGFGGQTFTKYNQFSNSNITGTITGNMYDKVRVVLPYDYSMVGDTYTLNIISGGTNISYTCATSKNPASGTTTSRNFDVTISNPATIAGSAQISFTFAFSRNNIIKQVTVTMNSCKKPTGLTTFSHGAKSIKPFTATGTCTLAMAYPFGTSSLSDVPTDYEAAALSTSFKMRYKAAGTYDRAFTETLTKSGDNLSITCNRANLFPWSSTSWTGLSHFSGILSYTAQLVFTNLYGAVFTTNTESCQFNFNEKPVSIGLSSLKYKSSSSATSYDKTFNTSNTYAQENLLLQFNLTVGLYTYDDLTLKIYRDSTLVKTVTKSKSELTFATSQTAAVNSISVNLNALSPILSTSSIIWKVEAYNKEGYIYDNAITATSVIQQGAAQLTLNSLVYNNDTVTYSMTLSSYGYSAPTGVTTSATYTLIDESDNEIATISVGVPATYSGTASVTGSWQTKTIRVRQRSTITAHTGSAPYVPLTNVKDVYSNSRIIYKAAPTVAYRQNQIGINTSAPASDAIIDIHAIDDKKYIKFGAQDSQGSPVSWVVSPSDGTIECTHFDTTLSVYSQRRINMLTGLMNNTWKPPLVSGYYAYADGTPKSSSTNAYFRTETLWAGSSVFKSITLHGSTYNFAIAYYDASGTYLGHSNYGHGIVYIPSSAIKIGVSFRKDGTQSLTNSDISAIMELLEVNYDSMFPSCPTDDGNYILKCEVTSSGVGNFSWTQHAPGPSGTSDYNELSNKPQIEGETLSGDKSFSDLHLVAISSNEINIIMGN